MKVIKSGMNQKTPSMVIITESLKDITYAVSDKKQVDVKSENT